MRVVACNQDEVSNRYDELKLFEVLFKKNSKNYKPDLQHVTRFSTGPFIYIAKFGFRLVSINVVRLYRRLFICYIQTLSQAINILQASNNLFPDRLSKHTPQ